jgi:hypothetical protein
VARGAAIGFDEIVAIALERAPPDRAFAAWEMVVRSHLAGFGAMTLTGIFSAGAAVGHRVFRRSLRVLWNRIDELEHGSA